MLDEAEVISTVRDLWNRHRDELAEHDRVYKFVQGKAGVPSVPEGAGDELKDIAVMSVKNVLAPVRDAFAAPLSIVGFRGPTETENAKAWKLWQAQKLDARQAEAHRTAVTYGTAYAIILADGIRLRSPRQVFAVYSDAHLDDWPVYALETWIDNSGRKPVRRGRLFDDGFIYPVSLGTLSRESVKAEQTNSTMRRATVTIEPGEAGAPTEHGFDHAPVARFINARDTEDVVIGEIEPLIGRQKAINAVNFDRLTVSRYGAFPQKYVIGWAPASPNELVQASVQRLMAFEESTQDVSVGAFPQASVDPYNSILAEMVLDVATTAHIPSFGLNGSVANLSAEAIALLLRPYKTKLDDKRASFGETWELVLRAFASLHDVEVPEDAEAVWDLDDARAFGAAIDGIQKLQAAGVPIEVLLDDVPGWSQQRLQAARQATQRAAGRGVLDALRDNLAGAQSGGGQQGQQAGQQAAGAAGTDREDAATLKAKADALGALIRAGVAAEAAAAQVGLSGLQFTGAVPVSLRLPEKDAGALEES